MTADERVRMMMGDLMVQLQVALAEIEKLKAEVASQAARLEELQPKTEEKSNGKGEGRRTKPHDEAA